MSTRRVLFVGGTADGRWYDVEGHHTMYRVPVPQRLPLADLGDTAPTAEIRADDYQIERFLMFGRTVWVALLSTLYSGERETAAIRALFQRDVADELTRGRP